MGNTDITFSDWVQVQQDWKYPEVIMSVCDHTDIRSANEWKGVIDENSTEQARAIAERTVERIDLRKLLLRKKSATEVDSILNNGGEILDSETSAMIKEKLRNPQTKFKMENNDVVITADNDGPRQNRCLVLDAPIRGWDCQLGDFARNRDVDEEDRMWKLAGPAPLSDTMGIGKTVYEWELNAEALLDSGASRDFVNERTQIARGWKKERASHALEVQVADGRVLRLDYVAAI